MLLSDISNEIMSVSQHDSIINVKQSLYIYTFLIDRYYRYTKFGKVSANFIPPESPNLLFEIFKEIKVFNLVKEFRNVIIPYELIFFYL